MKGTHDISLPLPAEQKGEEPVHWTTLSAWLRPGCVPIAAYRHCGKGNGDTPKRCSSHGIPAHTYTCYLHITSSRIDFGGQTDFLFFRSS